MGGRHPGRHPIDVADVWVDGVRRVADGRLVDHDLAAELVTRAGLERSHRPMPAPQECWATSTAPVGVGRLLGHAMLSLDEVVSIGLLEATVHLLHLQRALGVATEVPNAGLEHVVGCWPG